MTTEGAVGLTQETVIEEPIDYENNLLNQIKMALALRENQVMNML